MSNIICIESGSTEGKGTINKCSARCDGCGGEMIFHLCPDCDRSIIEARQVRLENGLVKARKTLILRQKTAQTEVYLKDLSAQRELQERENERILLRHSIILGLIVSVPTIVIGLNMTIENVIRPLGVALLLGGVTALSAAIHFRITHDNVKTAKQWMGMTSNEKTRLMENELLKINQSPTL